MNRKLLPMLVCGSLVHAALCGCAAKPQTEQDNVAKLHAEQDQAIAEIEKLGGKVVVDKKSPGNPVLSVDFFGTKVTDAGLEHLKGFTQLEELCLRGSQITDAGLESLKELRLLRLLDLSGTLVTDAGLKHLAGLTQLRKLWLCGTRVTDIGLEQVKEISQLRVLDCSSTSISDAGLEHLAGMKQLAILQLQGTRVTDEGVHKLKRSVKSVITFR